MNPVPDEMNELTFIASELTKFFGRTAMYNSTDYNGSHAGKIDVFLLNMNTGINPLRLILNI